MSGEEMGVTVEPAIPRTSLEGARVRALRAARASRACVVAAGCVALAAMGMYLHGWRSGWPTSAILAIVIPAAMVLATLSLAFDRILDERLRAEIALMDATVASMLSNED